MGFYSRYNLGRPTPTARPADKLPNESPEPAVAGPLSVVSVVPPPAAVYTPVNPMFPIGVQASPLLFLQPRPVESLLPVDRVGVAPRPAVQITRSRKTAGQTMAFPNPPSVTPVSQDFDERNRAEFPSEAIPDQSHVQPEDVVPDYVSTPVKSPMTPAMAGAAAGFFLGGPVGALAGAAAGFLYGKFR